MASARRGAAAAPRRRHPALGRGTAACASSAALVELGGQSVAVLAASASRAGGLARWNSITSARVSPYLRRSSWSSWRRCCTASSRAGSSSIGLAQRPAPRRPRRPARPPGRAAARRPRRTAHGRRARPAPGPAPATAPSSASSAARAASAASWWASGVGQRVLLGGQVLVLVGVGRGRPPSSSSTWKRSRSISRARARSSPPSAASSPVDLGQLARAACSGPRSMPPKRSSASRCTAGRQQRLVGVLAVQVDQRPPQLGQGGRGGQAPVDVGPRPALRRHDPAQHDLVAGPRRSGPRPPPPRRPWRTMAGSARPPTSRSMASTTRVLPAPVSPGERGHAGGRAPATAGR